MNSNFEELINKAIEICMEYDEVSPYLFSRRLRLNVPDGMRIFEELERRGIIIEARTEEDNIIGKINKKKISADLVN